MIDLLTWRKSFYTSPPGLVNQTQVGADLYAIVHGGLKGLTYSIGGQEYTDTEASGLRKEINGSQRITNRSTNESAGKVDYAILNLA